ncbi:MAG: HDIG domain-containing protein [Anaerolineae bacterium]|nr:HDIG domain-containing protein [Anaerolineae bacterium]MDK1079841.1 HDIG domain-containing protein [Anaerolineae bacterium]
MVFAQSGRISTRIRTIQISLLVSVGLISMAALIVPLSLNPGALPLSAGEVAPRDLQAPDAIEYVSEVRTEEARAAAERAVPQIYSVPDPSTARGQIERLRAALDYISLVRIDEYASPEQKQADLESLSDLSLDVETTQQIMDLSSARWDTIQQESLSVLEQVMRNTIREANVQTLRRSVPSLVSLALTAEQARLVPELVSAFIVPNSFKSPELTESARQEAREAVQPVVQTYKPGEMVVAGGQIINLAQVEALEKLGLIEPGQQWQDYLGIVALGILTTVFIGLYFFRRNRSYILETRSMVLIAVTFIIFLIGARLTIPDRTIIPYLYPLAAFGLLLATLFGMEAGIIFSLPLAILAAYGLPNTLDLMPYYLLSTLTAILVLGPARRFSAFLRAGATIAGAGIAMILAFRLPFVQMDWLGIATLLGAAIFNGFASAGITLLLQYYLTQTLGLTTPLQLLEISRPDSPLMQFLLRNAPGTYQHSLQVANMAEQAAERVGADALLTRVGALYHDVGKARKPRYFIENQVPGSINMHDDLDPAESSRIIINHIPDGIELARKYRLPNRIDDFILEHHGTMLTRYQYSNAVEAAGGDESKVSQEKFRYPGPRPRSRETALLMLADGTEARVRAGKPENEKELTKIVRAAIDHAQGSGQLDNTRLTLRDLSRIVQSFVTTLRGSYHSRIEYPKSKNTPGLENVQTTPRNN